MANRRCLHALTRHSSALLSRAPASLSTPPIAASSLAPKSLPAVRHLLAPISPALWPHPLHFSSDTRDSEGDEDEETDEECEDGEETDEEYEDGEEEEEDSDFIGVSRLKSGRRYTPEEKEAETAAIGYKVTGPLQDEDRVFKPYKPVFAVVQIGSHQFKVSNTDCIFVERLKFCEVNDKLILNKVLLLGSSTQTIIGRPFLPEAAVHAVVEEHALDAKVIIFKKKRRKNYRRTNGHRQELTKLRITDIEGIEVPETEVAKKPPKAIVTEKKPEKVPIAT